MRLARAGDGAAIKSLIDQLEYSTTAEEVDQRLTAIAAAGQTVLVAELEAEVIGCLSTSMMTVLHRPAPVGRISMMVVDERFRGQGIGKKLVTAAEGLLASRGCQLVEVTSHVRRTDAHRFWEGKGYERTSARFAKVITKPVNSTSIPRG